MSAIKGLLGVTEEIVLTGIADLEEDAYGLRLHEWLEQVTGKGYSVGTIYTTASRLETRGYVRSEERIVENRARRYYRIEAEGRHALREMDELRRRMAAARHQLPNAQPEVGR